MNKIKNLYYRIFVPGLKAKYQFGSPIVALYQFEDVMVVATKIDIYITKDGKNYERVSKN